MVLSYSSTKFIRFNAILWFFKYVQVDSFTAAWVAPRSNSLFPLLLNLLLYIPYSQASTSSSQYKYRLHAALGEY